jgi:hypothetical protein
MRQRCEVAVDQAAHVLVTDPEYINLPDSGLNARLKGDLQSLDAEGVRYCYFLRPSPDSAPPQWLGNFGAHVRKVPNVQVLGVYYEATDALREAYRNAGLGLLVLRDDSTFELVVDFDLVAPDRPSDEILQELTELRRELERKIAAARADVAQRNGSINKLTEGMKPAAKTQYMTTIETEYRLWTEWADELSRELDELHVKFDQERFETVKTRVQVGAIEAGTES